MAFTASTVWETQTTGLDDFSTVSAVVAVGGTGYSVGNTLTVVGGTSTTTATFTVSAVSGGVVTVVTVANSGHYTVLPTNPVATTGGAGTCTLTLTWNAGGNGGGFDTGVAGFPTDGAATVANTSAPVFTSASYNFVAGDVGAWIYIKSGTNWTPGWYKIASVASNAATLNGTIGAAVLAAGTPTTVVGCATTASPTSATWGIDYSQGAARIAFTDMVIAVTTTNFTSAGNPVGKNFVGNIIAVTGGVNFTVQRVAVVSTSGTTATCDKSLGTAAAITAAGGTTGAAAAVSGTGNMGGPLGSPGQASLLRVASNLAWIKSGTYSVTSASTNIPQGCVSDAVGGQVKTWEGYGTVRGDLGVAPILQANGISTATLFAVTGASTAGSILRNMIADGASLTSILGFSLGRRGTAYALTAKNCTNGGLSCGPANLLVKCSATNITGGTAAFIGCQAAYYCEAFSNTITGFTNSSTGGSVFWGCLSYGNTGATSDGFQFSSSAQGCAINCVAYGNGRDGLRWSNGESSLAINCIAEGNGVTATGAGFNASSAAIGATVTLLNCGVFGNTANSSVNISTNITGPQVGTVTATSTFFVNAVGGNFALNNNSGAGAACRAAGIPGVFPSGTTTGLIDIGAAQSRVPWQTQALSGGIEG